MLLHTRVPKLTAPINGVPRVARPTSRLHEINSSLKSSRSDPSNMGQGIPKIGAVAQVLPRKEPKRGIPPAISHGSGQFRLTIRTQGPTFEPQKHGTISSVWLERHVDIVEVTGSSPVSSIFF